MNRVRHVILIMLSCSLAAGCVQHKSLTLMPTPAIYADQSIEPFSHLATPLQSPQASVFYATTRRPETKDTRPVYGNGIDDVLHLGRASVQIGEPGTTWDELVQISLNNLQDSAIPLSVDDVTRWGSLEHRGRAMVDWQEESHERFISEIQDELTHHADREIMLYVHGTATNFEHGVAMTGELEHFAGRDFVGVAYLWPSHRNILYYLLREDVRRARHSSKALSDLLRLLAAETIAKRINIVCWSAGGRVVSLALQDLRRSHPELDEAALRQRYRLGAVVFAAADVEYDRFLERLPAVSELSEQVVITVSDADDALRSAERFMAGASRAGSTRSEDAELDFRERHHLNNVEVIDVSMSKEARGFDITGHHYWYRNAWSSSDLILLLRTLLPPDERGLRPASRSGLWYLDPEYPDRARRALRQSLAEDWGTGDE